MASISADSNGTRRLLLTKPDGRRQTVYLGHMSQRDAERFRDKVEDLQSAAKAGEALPAGLQDWVDDLGDDLRDKLAKLGLVKPRQVMTVGALLDAWWTGKAATYQPGTLVRLEQGRRSLQQYFGADRLITTITTGQAEDYRASLLGEGLAEATVRKRCSDARMWFDYAQRHGWLKVNPFKNAKVPTCAIATAEWTYVSEADAMKVLAEITSPTLRLIFVLARWGGLRTISEPRELTWDCVDWEHGRMTVLSPKTKRHPGRDKRVVPIFPEIREPLLRVFDQAEPGERYVLPKLRRVSSASLRKPMEAAILRAGVKPWPRLFHNLRASRQTDLEQRHPSHVVCAWLGNSPAIAMKHYLRVTDGDFERALEGSAKCSALAAQNAAQPGEADKCHEVQEWLQVLEMSGFPASDGIKPHLGAGQPSDPYGI